MSPLIMKNLPPKCPFCKKGFLKFFGMNVILISLTLFQLCTNCMTERARLKCFALTATSIFDVSPMEYATISKSKNRKLKIIEQNNVV